MCSSLHDRGENVAGGETVWRITLALNAGADRVPNVFVDPRPYETRGHYPLREVAGGSAAGLKGYY